MDTLNLQILAAAIALLLFFVQVLALVVAVRVLGRTAARIEISLEQIQAELTATMRQTRATLEKVEKLAKSSDELMAAQFGPTLESARSMIGEVEESARRVRGGVDGIQTAMRSVASVSGSGALAFVAKTVYNRGGKIGLLALGLGAALRALLSPSRQKAQATPGRKKDVARK